NVVVILTLMIIVAIVTIISGMLILMVDKIRIIALLAALGAGRRLIGRIFMRLALRIAFGGLIIGNIIAISILYFQQNTHFVPLDPESYYIDFVPVEISYTEIAVLNIAIILVIWLSLILPAGFAGKVAPARTLASE
ncbi:MAG: ABC transporter permease, partial [Muribaculaceae bacterium]|nr:ABC transporter permease [Muribaculaceae bacterium]